MKRTQDIEWLDTLRAIAIISVITIHVSTPIVKMTYGVFMDLWWIGNFIDSMVRFAVPAFLMLSGATLLSKTYKIAEFYKKRFMRVLLPFLFWIPIYYIFRWTTLPYEKPKTIETIFKWAIELFMKEGISKHFWYVYMILVLYLFTPFIGKGLQKLNNKNILYILLLWFFLCIAYSIGFINTSNWPSLINKLLYYFLNSGYMVLGFYLNKFNIPTKRQRLASFVLYLISILLTAFTTYYISQKAQKLNLMLYGYLAANTIIQSFAVFVILKGTAIKQKNIKWIRNIISNYSYGIYLVHIMVIGIFYNHGIFWTMFHPLVSVPIIILLTLVVSTAIIYLLRKIPYGKYIAG